MTVFELQKEILELKEKNDVCILAHSYQTHDIIEVADFTGDSFALSVKAQSVPQKTVIMCGVRFMAETVKLLSPEKRVILSSAGAGCPMAEQMSKEYIQSINAEHPDYAVVAYINTTASLKTVCDVCVTSSSAVKIVKSMPQKNILFIPDCNLGDFVKRQVTDKNIMLLDGGCPVHQRVCAQDVLNAEKEHPGVKLLVHPECKPEVVQLADMVGSTADIMNYAKNSDDREFIIGTEISITDHLSYECPDKRFYNLSKKLICGDMKLTTLNDIYRILKENSGEEITLDDDTMTKARVCIDKMLELGK